MKIKKIWIAAAILTICIGVLWAANKTDSPKPTPVISDKETLKGLQNFGVFVAPLKTEAQKHGLTRQQLQTDVELKLRQNGINVLSDQEWLTAKAIDGPCLIVNVSMLIRQDSPVIAFNISLELSQKVLLERDPTKICEASTWNTDSVGSVGLKEIQSIRESVKDEVDKFINDYLAVNPK